MTENGCTITAGQVKVSSGSDRTVKGPLCLCPEHIESVPENPGVYVLGDTHRAPVYVGRADEGLRASLTEHLPGQETTPRVREGKPELFWHERTVDADKAREVELEWYFRYRPECDEAVPECP